MRACTAEMAALDGGASTGRGVLPGTPQGPGAGPAPAPAAAARITTGLSFAPIPDSVPTARGYARAVLAEWGVTRDTAQVIELVVSELVTNAVAESGKLPGPVPSAVWLRLHDRRDLVVIEVIDFAPGVPGDPPASRDDADEHGRGLLIVATVAAGWGTCELRGGGKAVWAAVPAGRAT